MTNSTIAAAQAAAEAARNAAAQAQQALANAEANAHADAAQRATEAWQDYADTYDAKADRAAVTTARDELHRALQETELGRAMTDYAAAILRERTRRDLAGAAAQAGADVQLPTGNRDMSDAEGTSIAVWGSMQGFMRALLGDTATELAQATADAEASEIRAAVNAAQAEANAPAINAYKITAKRTLNGQEHVGVLSVTFVDSVSYLPTSHPALPWFQRSEGYDVTPVYAVPEEWTEAERIFTTEQTGSGFLAGA